MRRLFRPILAGAQLPARLVACLGAALAIGVTMLVGAHVPLAVGDLPAIVAPLGASAVLALAVPASPLAQPWSVIGGNVISTLVGVAVYRLIPDATVAAGVAVGAAILVMSLLRCLHPPGGAAALTAVIGGANIHAAGFAFAFIPVGLNSIVLVLLALGFNRLTGHSYPHHAQLAPAATPPTPVAPGFHAGDIDAALADLGESFDIAREDLDLLLSRAELHAQARLAQPPISLRATSSRSA